MNVQSGTATIAVAACALGIIAGTMIVGRVRRPTKYRHHHPHFPDVNLGQALDVTMTAIADVNRANGWHDGTRTFGEDVALLHSEVSEALEAHRKGDDDNLREELADVLIRLLDTWYRLGETGFTFADEIINKIDRNRQRGYRHGGKVL